ncbi:MAG: EutN/CcmL family microcompartment protein [Candidatus Aureabacteria bacterium]|nr:EutN/CcmL family microcompartment protein [Candidatus Auribacterota bacterium]
MKIGKVIGTVVATLKHEGFNGRKLLLVRPEDPHGKKTETPVVAVDTVRAGVGDHVLFVDEGNSARQVLDWTDGCVRAVIVGYIDEVNLAENPKSPLGFARDKRIPNPKQISNHRPAR